MYMQFSSTLSRHLKNIKESNAASSKKTPNKQGKDKEIKCSESKNATTTISKSNPSEDKTKSAAKKIVKTVDAKEPVSTDAASKGTNADSGRRKSTQPSTG